MSVTRRRRPRAAGFTIIELMVSMVAGLILVTAVYYVGAGSARHFQEQQRIAQTQMNVRMAMENLRADVARAGYLATPNSRRAKLCPGYTGVQTQAVELIDDGGIANLPNAGANLARADVLRLVANYATGDEYMVWQIGGGGTQIELQPTWQAYRRSFMNPTTGATVPEAFNEVFTPGRVIRLTSTNGHVFFATITGRTATTNTVAVTPALPVPGNGDSCIPGYCTGCTIAPLSRIEYRVLPATGNLSALAPRNATVTGPAAILARREIAFTAAATPLAGTTPRSVLEWVADFEVDFVMDTAGVGAPPNLVISDGTAVAGDLVSVAGAPAARPDRVRSVIVQLSGRTSEQDPLFPFAARASDAVPMRSFQAIPGRPGAARVRTLRSEIFLPNLAR